VVIRYPNENDSEVPRPASCRLELRGAVHQWTVFLPPRSVSNQADAAIFALRELAARIHEFRCRFAADTETKQTARRPGRL